MDCQIVLCFKKEFQRLKGSVCRFIDIRFMMMRLQSCKVRMQIGNGLGLEWEWELAGLGWVENAGASVQLRLGCNLRAQKALTGSWATG